jgi:LmbE family N-acetylglucosaminyl deacetylase
MKQIRTTDDVKQLGTILCVWAHPDDETVLAGGVMAAAVNNGQLVVCITATKGEAGKTDKLKWPGDLGAIRANELAHALAKLGVTHHYYLECADGFCNGEPQANVLPVLHKIIDTYQPDSILTFGPDGWSGHPDHKQVSQWVSKVVRTGNKEIAVYHVVHTPKQYQDYLKKIDKDMNFFFNIERPPLANPEVCSIYFELSPEISKRKCESLKEMPSQMEKLFQLYPDEFINQAFGVEVFVKAPRTRI